MRTEDEYIKRLADRKIVVMLCNRNQEKDFIHACRIHGFIVPRKDETAYIDKLGHKKAIFPIYYGFDMREDERCVIGWWDIDTDCISENEYIIIDHRSFKINMERGDGNEKVINQ